MPPRRKIDLLPEELRAWLQEELIASGFSDYEGIAGRLADRLEGEGLELSIGKSAIHAFGQDFKDYAERERRAQEEMKAFLKEANLSDEIDITSLLFQQLSALTYRLQKEMAGPDGEIDPRGVKDLTTALNNLIRSTALRSTIVAEDRKAQAAKLDGAVASGEIDIAAAQKARAIMGFA